MMRVRMIAVAGVFGKPFMRMSEIFTLRYALVGVAVVGLTFACCVSQALAGPIPFTGVKNGPPHTDEFVALAFATPLKADDMVVRLSKFDSTDVIDLSVTVKHLDNTTTTLTDPWLDTTEAPFVVVDAGDKVYDLVIGNIPGLAAGDVVTAFGIRAIDDDPANPKGTAEHFYLNSIRGSFNSTDVSINFNSTALGLGAGPINDGGDGSAVVDADVPGLVTGAVGSGIGSVLSVQESGVAGPGSVLDPLILTVTAKSHLDTLIPSWPDWNAGVLYITEETERDKNEGLGVRAFTVDPATGQRVLEPSTGRARIEGSKEISGGTETFDIPPSMPEPAGLGLIGLALLAIRTKRN